MNANNDLRMLDFPIEPFCLLSLLSMLCSVVFLDVISPREFLPTYGADNRLHRAPKLLSKALVSNFNVPINVILSSSRVWTFSTLERSNMYRSKFPRICQQMDETDSRFYTHFSSLFRAYPVKCSHLSSGQCHSPPRGEGAITLSEGISASSGFQPPFVTASWVTES